MYGDVPEKGIRFFFRETINILLEGHETFPAVVCLCSVVLNESPNNKLSTCRECISILFYLAVAYKVTFNSFLLVDKWKLFSNVHPTICQRKSSSLAERSLNSRLLKIIQYSLKKSFEIAKWLKKNFFENVFMFICTQENFQNRRMVSKKFFREGIQVYL